MNDPTRWTDTARDAAALAALSHLAQTIDGATGGPTDNPRVQPGRWNAHDVWLSRIKQPRDIAASISK